MKIFAAIDLLIIISFTMPPKDAQIIVVLAFLYDDCTVHVMIVNEDIFLILKVWIWKFIEELGRNFLPSFAAHSSNYFI